MLADDNFPIGITLASFHSYGVSPLVIQLLKSLVMFGAITLAVDFRRWAGIPVLNIHPLQQGAGNGTWTRQGPFLNIQHCVSWERREKQQQLKWQFRQFARETRDCIQPGVISTRATFLFMAKSYIQLLTYFGCLWCSLQTAAK